MAKDISKRPIPRQRLADELLECTRVVSKAFASQASTYGNSQGGTAVGWATNSFNEMASIVFASIKLQAEQEKEIEALKTRLEALENPKTVTLDKKRLDPPSPKP